MSQQGTPRKNCPGSPVGAVYTSIIKTAQFSALPRPTADSYGLNRMTSIPRSTQPQHAPSSLTESAVFYDSPPAAQPRPLSNGSPGNEVDERAFSFRVRKRDKVKMVGHHLHSAFRSWFKEVSTCSLQTSSQPLMHTPSPRPSRTGHRFYPLHCLESIQ